MSSASKEKAQEIHKQELGGEIDDVDKATPVQTGFNIIKTIVGAGIFCTAFGLHLAGFYFGLFLIILMGFIFYWTIMTLTYASVKSETENIQELLKFCFGTPGVIVLNLSLLMIGLGGIMVYNVIIADSIPNALQSIMGKPQTDFMVFFLSRRGMIIILDLLVLLPISMAKSMAGLAKFSGLAMLFVLIIAISLIADAPFVSQDYLGDTSQPLSIFNIDGLAGAINVFAFAYVCQHNLLLNYHQMKNKNLETFAKINKVTLPVTCVLTIMIGSVYIIFRERSTPNILNAYPKDDIVIIISRLLFGIDLMLSYPLGLYVVRDTIEKSFFKSREFSNIRHTILTLLIVGTTLTVSCLTCDLGAIVSLAGGLGAVTIAFILPGACWIKVNRIKGVKLSWFSFAGHVLCIIFGFGLIGMTIYDFIVNIVSPSDKVVECGW